LKAIITVSDLHVGSTAGLCLPRTMVVDQGSYSPNKYQKTLRKYWVHFWREWVPEMVKGAKLVALVINGDAIDGVHHGTVNIISNSLEVQEKAAVELIQEIREICPKKIDEIYIIKGSEAHTEVNGQCEERIAKQVGAVPLDKESASYQRWIELEDVVFQFAHNIGVTSSAAYETSAPMRELVAALTEAAQWGQPLPDVVVRSHRHRFVPVAIPSQHGRIQCVITPGWQLRTPHVERIDRMRMPHIGGVVFKCEEGICDLREKIYPLPGPKARQI